MNQSAGLCEWRLHLTFRNLKPKKNKKKRFCIRVHTQNPLPKSHTFSITQQHAHPAKITFSSYEGRSSTFTEWCILFVSVHYRSVSPVWVWAMLSEGGGCFMARLKTGHLMFDLQGIQKAVDAADQLLPLAWQGFIRVDVGVLLHLSGHQALGLLTGSAHQILQLVVQLLYLNNLQTEKPKTKQKSSLKGQFTQKWKFGH